MQLELNDSDLRMFLDLPATTSDFEVVRRINTLHEDPFAERYTHELGCLLCELILKKLKYVK